MSFVHENAEEFADLVQIVAGERGLRRSIVEKDYWATHTLWALSTTGLDVWFKGGTSLSKGFGLIERFSEDLDLKIEPGTATALPSVSNWRNEGTKATGERKAFFEQLPNALAVPGCRVELELARKKAFIWKRLARPKPRPKRAWRSRERFTTSCSPYPARVAPRCSSSTMLRPIAQ